MSTEFGQMCRTRVFLVAVVFLFLATLLCAALSGSVGASTDPPTCAQNCAARSCWISVVFDDEGNNWVWACLLYTDPFEEWYPICEPGGYAMTLNDSGMCDYDGEEELSLWGCLNCYPYCYDLIDNYMGEAVGCDSCTESPFTFNSMSCQ
jgi:hypothetical protein